MKKNKNKLKLSSLALALLLSYTILLIQVNEEVSSPLEIESNGLKNSASSESAQKVVDYFRTVFQSDWKRGETYDPDVDGYGGFQSRDPIGSSYEPYTAKQITDTMKITPILSPDNSEEQIISLINSATQTLDIEQMYMYSSLTQLNNAIISAHNSGVTVRVILNDDDDSKAVADSFKAAGIDVKVCTGTAPMYFNTQHNKGFIIDGVKVLIASINLSPTSLRENREAGLIIESDQVANYYKTLFNHDWSVCEDYDPGLHLSSLSLSNIDQIAISKSENLKSSYTNEFSSAPTYEGQMNITAIASPDNCYDVVADLLKAANKSIDISVYTLSHQHILDILVDKIEAGIKVRLLLEKNPVSNDEKGYNRHSLYNLTMLHSAQGLWASSDFDFQHCKYSIIDNVTLILSSGNWAKTSCPKPQDDGDVDGNRDWWIVLYGGTPKPLDESTNSGGDTSSDTSNEDLEELIDAIPSFPLPILIGIITISVSSIIVLKFKKKATL